MKKWFALAVLAVSLGIVPAAHAQFHPRNVSPSGKIAGNGSGANGAVVTRLSIHFNYTAKGHVFTDRTDTTGKLFIDYLNKHATNKKDVFRFEMLPFNTPSASLHTTLHVKFYNNSNNTYSAFISVNGWSVGHMFNTRATDSVNIFDPGHSLIKALNQAESLLQSGWVIQGSR